MKQREKNILMLVMLLGLCATACQDIKKIPLFNPQSSLKNKIASAYEFYAETNNQVNEAVASGLITTADVESLYVPKRDIARKLIDEADALRIAGDSAGSGNKIDTAKAVLVTLHDELKRLKGGH